MQRGERRRSRGRGGRRHARQDRLRARPPPLIVTISKPHPSHLDSKVEHNLLATGGAVRRCEARVASVPHRWTRRASSGDAGAAPVLRVNGAARVGSWLPFDLVLRLRALGRATPRYSRLEKERWRKTGGRQVEEGRRAHWGGG
jgi:hypothetical protein